MKSSDGNTIIPNSYQKPNYFADELMRLLTPTENTVLDAACRKILGWDAKRVTRRDRISASQFCEMTGLARNTIKTCVAELALANILLPVGEANSAGPEYELNLGQLGDYDLSYLTERERRASGNPSPDAGLSAMHATRKQPALLPPDVGGRGGQILTPQTLTLINQMKDGVSIIDQPPDQPLITQKPKTNKGEIDSPETWIRILADLAADRSQLRQLLLDAVTATEDAGTLTLEFDPSYPAARQHAGTLQRVAKKLNVQLAIKEPAR